MSNPYSYGVVPGIYEKSEPAHPPCETCIHYNPNKPNKAHVMDNCYQNQLMCSLHGTYYKEKTGGTHED